MSSRRVVITGLGAVTPIGNNVNDFWNAVKEKKTGFGPITEFDAAGYKASIAAEVKDFNPKDHMDPKSARRMERFAQFAVAAAGEALTDSGLDLENEDMYRIGVSVGSGVGSLQAMEREYATLLEKGPNRVAPLTVPLLIGNMAAANICILYGFKGKSIDVVTACASGTNCIGEALRTIQCGDADIMFAGGTDACICKIGIAAFCALTALTTTDDPARASIPFDKDRSGFVMGEGAGVLVLEELDHALARGAKIYAEVAGYGSTSDAYNLTAPLEDGSGAARAMELAIKDAGLTPDDVDYVNAHGTSTQLNDVSETKAIKLALGSHAYDVKVNSTKSMVGHLLGAAGAVEAIVCAKSIEDSYVHATVGLENDDPECDLDYCKGEGVYMEVNCAISNSLGFGGHNATILLRKYKD